MREAGGDFDFTKKPLRSTHRGQFGTQHLHRHLTAMFQILGAIYGGPPGPAEFSLDALPSATAAFRRSCWLAWSGMPLGRLRSRRFKCM